MAGRRGGKGAGTPGGKPPAAEPLQLTLPLAPAEKRPGRKARAAAGPEGASPTAAAPVGPPSLQVLDGGGAGAGHARARLTVVGGQAASLHLPDRGELDRVLLGALADLLAGRITPTAAAAIREAAVATIRAHDRVEADPERLPELVRAARALRELVGAP